MATSLSLLLPPRSKRRLKSPRPRSATPRPMALVIIFFLPLDKAPFVSVLLAAHCREFTWKPPLFAQGPKLKGLLHSTHSPHDTHPCSFAPCYRSPWEASWWSPKRSSPTWSSIWPPQRYWYCVSICFFIIHGTQPASQQPSLTNIQ